MLRIAILLLALMTTALANPVALEIAEEGEWICGPKPAEADLKNKVILMEYWGLS